MPTGDRSASLFLEDTLPLSSLVSLVVVGVALRLILTLLKTSFVLDLEGRGRATVAVPEEEVEEDARRELSCEVNARELGRFISCFCFFRGGAWP